MKNLKILALGIALTSVSTISTAASVITDWKFINEAGFANATTGGSALVDGVRTTLDPDTLVPLNSTGELAPTNGNEWIYNADTGLYYDLGSAGYVAGSSHTGSTAGASGKQIGQSIFEEVGIPTGALSDEICWGYGPSCLQLASGAEDTSRVEGTATTLANGGLSWNEGTDLTHTNKLTGEPSLTSIDFVDGLKLYSDALIAGELNLLQLGFEVIFNETFGTPAQVHFDYAPDDAFIINLNPLLGVISNIGADFVEISQFFDLTGLLVDDTAHTEYEVVIRVSGLEVVSTPGGGNTFGLVTPEGSTSELTSMFAIRAVGVSEPTTLAIFALSLLGLAGASRRKKA
jgi:hypothetical protein